MSYSSQIESTCSEQSIPFVSADGEFSAINELFAACMPRLRKTAERLLRNHEDSEDVLQEALLSGFQNIHQFQCRSKFSTWMHTILCNSARTMWRKQRCRPAGFSVDLETHDDDQPHFADSIAASGLGPEEEYSRKESSRIVAELLAELPLKYREVVQLCKIEELKITDAAEQLGVQAGTVKARMHRARRMIEKRVNNRKASEGARLPVASRVETLAPPARSAALPSPGGKVRTGRARRNHSRRLLASSRALAASGGRIARNVSVRFPP